MSSSASEALVLPPEPKRPERNAAPAAAMSSTGIGLRGPHIREFLQTLPGVGWLEVHSENYFGAGGSPISSLLQARKDYPISLHGVGLSIGSTDALHKGHLSSLKKLIQTTEPILVSEHLSWGSVGGIHFNDLLPLPYTEEALHHFCGRVVQIQEYLDHRILIENPSSYVRFRHSTIPEWEFLNTISERTGAGLLLDINNVYVSACNHGFDPVDYLAAVSGQYVEEIHLAGHTLKTFADGELRIDDHASPVCTEVWSLFQESLKMIGQKRTLIEWDAKLPSLDRLLAEARMADQLIEAEHGRIV